MILSAVAPPARAEPWRCEMTLRCADFACAPVTEPLTLIAADHEGRLFLSGRDGDIAVDRLTDAGALPAAYAGRGAGMLGLLMTVDADGAAILSRHGGAGSARFQVSYGFCGPMGAP